VVARCKRERGRDNTFHHDGVCFQRQILVLRTGEVCSERHLAVLDMKGIPELLHVRGRMAGFGEVFAGC
jgi:hypothetical protein